MSKIEKLFDFRIELVLVQLALFADSKLLQRK